MLPRVILLFLSFFFLSLSLATASSDKSTTNNQIEIIKSNEKVLELSFRPKLHSFQEILTSDNQISYKPTFYNAYNTETSAGNYMIITRKEYITVPSENGYQIKNVLATAFKPEDKLMAPVPAIDGFDIDYKHNNLPGEFEVFSYKYIGVINGRHTLELNFVLAYYDTELEQTMIAQKFDVSIDFKGANKYSNNKNFDPILSLNHHQSKAFRVSKKRISKAKNTLLANDYDSKNWIKINIESQGVYRITASQLSDMGASISNELINSIRVFGHGGQILDEKVDLEKINNMPEQAIIVNKNSNGSLKEIIFYAQSAKGFFNDDDTIKRYNNPYDKKASYMLSWGGSAGKRANAEAFDGEIVNNPEFYTQRYFYEQEELSPFPFGAGRQFIGNIVNKETYTHKLANLYRKGKVKYFLALAHQSQESALFTATQNGQDIKLNKYITGASAYTPTTRILEERKIPASMIAGDEVSKLKIKYKNSVSVSAYGYMDYYEIHYDRYFRASGNEINFFSDNVSNNGGTEFSVSGFSSSAKYIYDISDLSNPKLLKNYASSNKEVKIKTEIDNSKFKQFFASSNLRTPELSKVSFENLRNSNESADILLFTHKDLLSSAKRYKEHRESLGEFTVKIIELENLYNNFSSGMTDPVAIRDFTAYAYHNWEVQPRFVFLWGDGHSDYKYLHYKAKNYVPPFEVDDNDTTFDENYNYASDDFYTKVAGDDDKPDLAVGRVTIDSPKSGEIYLDKLIHYETSAVDNNWRTNIILVADDGWKSDGGDDGGTHVDASENLANLVLPDFMKAHKLYLPKYKTEVINGEGRRKPTLNADLVDKVRDGAVFLNYIGHGNPYVWSHEAVLTKDKTVKEFNNYNKLCFVTAATCDFSRFDQTKGRTAADELVLSERGGAIGVFAATRIVYSGANEALNEKFYSYLFTRDESGRYMTCGEALQSAKQTRVYPNDRKYFILGDPSMRVNIPEYNIAITQINGEYVDKNKIIEIKGLSVIELKGQIENRRGTLIPDYNGDVSLIFHDGSRDYEIFADKTTFYFAENGGILNFSRAKVIDGKFSVKFQLPKDISFSENNGNLFAYASDKNGRFAKGNVNSFKVYGIDQDAPEDNEKPEVSIFLDSTNFVAGAVVSNEPILIIKASDNMGINSTGYGIGHKIEAYIDASTEAIDLTQSYIVDEDDNLAGLMKQRLHKLEPGYHSVKVRVWDLQNNYSIAITHFYVEENYKITNLLPSPNPFSFGTSINFEHNINPPFETQTQIVDYKGKNIRKINSLINSSKNGQIVWDGNDEYGNKVSESAYTYIIKVIDLDGNMSYHQGSLLVKVKTK